MVCIYERRTFQHSVSSTYCHIWPPACQSEATFQHQPTNFVTSWTGRFSLLDDDICSLTFGGYCYQTLVFGRNSQPWRFTHIIQVEVWSLALAVLSFGQPPIMNAWVWSAGPERPCSLHKTSVLSSDTASCRRRTTHRSPLVADLCSSPFVDYQDRQAPVSKQHLLWGSLQGDLQHIISGVPGHHLINLLADWILACIEFWGGMISLKVQGWIKSSPNISLKQIFRHKEIQVQFSYDQAGKRCYFPF